MDFSYRLKKKELIFLLDLFGDVNKLEQKFADVYIDREEHRKIAQALHEKGFATIINEEIIPDSHIAFLIKKFYSSELMLSDESVSVWLYCSEELVLRVASGDISPSEYIITPFIKEDLEDMADGLGNSVFSVMRGSNGTVEAGGLCRFIREFSYGK
ncbi:MAG: hypothetical protein E7505_06075 [Ruminococcus sp.]|jgi:hypothetical protein|nr:hypothetical protein [Ruminococcus sp.]